MSTHTHIQFETTAGVGEGKLDISDPAIKDAYPTENLLFFVIISFIIITPLDSMIL